MTKTELKEAKERYFMLSKMIRGMTAQSLVKETADEQEARIKYLLRPENYIKFFDYYYGIDSGLPLADAPSSSFHQDNYERIYKDPFIKLFMRWFRGGGKSIHADVGYTTHLKQNDLMSFLVLVGRNENMAKILLQDVQVQLESNERYIKDFGMQLSYGNWADGQFESTDNKHFKALGINQPFRGLRYGSDRVDLAIIDDCEDRDQAKNKEMIRKYGDKVVGDLGKAIHLRRGRFLLPQNYIVKDGLNDYILKKWEKSKHLHVSTVNLTDADGNPSFPERYSREDTDRINEDTDYYTSQREDYNNPIEEGKLFKSAQMLKRKVHHREGWNGFLIHWDLSYTATGDYKAGCLLGIQGMHITVLGVFCQRCALNSAMEQHFTWVEEVKAKGYSAMGFYDASVAQQAVYAPLIEQCAEDYGAVDIPFPDHQQGDKHNRIEAGITNALHRKILYWDDRLEGKDFDSYMEQLLSFEKGVKTDDAPDNLERGISLSQKYYGYSKNDRAGGKPVIGKRKKKRRV